MRLIGVLLDPSNFMTLALGQLVANYDASIIPAMSNLLQRILATGTIDRVEEHGWKGGTYLQVFVVRRKDCVWDGPKTGLVMKLVDEPLGAKSKLRQKEETKKKGGR